MITTEEISQVAYAMLVAAKEAGDLTISGNVDYERTDYTGEDVIIVPHTIDGEASQRFGQVKVNIHVPDLVLTDNATGKTVTRRNDSRLVAIRSQVVEILKDHVEKGSGWNWYIDRFNPAIKEQNHDEHFMSLSLQIVVREKQIK